MALTEKDLLFASLAGKGVIRHIPQLNIIQNELQKHVLPPIPFLPFPNETTISQKDYGTFENLGIADAPTPEDRQFFPLSLSLDEGKTWFLLPYETMINIAGKNNLVRRSVAKWKDVEGVRERRGTVKERYSYDDYQIDITGVLIGSLLTGSVEDCYPRDDFQKLNKVLKGVKAKVKCPPFELLGIGYIAIEDFTFPFTKGENVQAYTIKAYSDYSFNLILT